MRCSSMKTSRAVKSTVSPSKTKRLFSSPPLRLMMAATRIISSLGEKGLTT